MLFTELRKTLRTQIDEKERLRAVARALFRQTGKLPFHGVTKFCSSRRKGLDDEAWFFLEGLYERNNDNNNNYNNG